MYLFFLVRLVSSGVMFNGFIIKDYKVEKIIEMNWIIFFFFVNCGFFMLFFFVVEYIGNENGSFDDVIYIMLGFNFSV